MPTSFQDKIKSVNNDMSKTVVIDLDGVIVDFDNCPHKDICDYNSYPETSNLHRDKCKLNTSAIHYLNSIKSNLHLSITIYTSRVEKERSVTKRWLEHNNVPYDTLVMNKPRGFIYCDDLGFKFNTWKETYDEIKRRVL